MACTPLSFRHSSIRGFNQYFRRFIDHYSDIARPLEEATSRYTRFSWSTAQQKAFDRLKECLLTAPVLQLVDSTKKLCLVTDASDCAVAGVLLQEDGSGDWHPIAYTSRRLNSAEQNYYATERETLAVIHSHQMWRIYFYKPFEIVTDNRAVTYLRTKKDLTRREARWIDLLADFDFSMTHRPGWENLADSLSRRPDLEAFAIEGQCVLHSEEEHDIWSGYEADRRAQAIVGRLAKSQDNYHKRYPWNDQEHRLFVKTDDRWRLYVPKGAWRLRLLKEHHDAGSAGHPGRARTYSRLARLYFWPGMSIDVKRFVRSCDVCQRMKSGRQNQGLSQPLLVPEQPWQHISMDLIVGLPRTQRGFDSIYTFVDRLTKCVHLVPTTATVDAAGAAQLYIYNVFKLHGLSQTITCDRDPRFTAEFF